MPFSAKASLTFKISFKSTMLWQLTLTAPAELCLAAEDTLDVWAQATSQIWDDAEKLTGLVAYASNKPDAIFLSRLDILAQSLQITDYHYIIATVPENDWVQQVLNELTPLQLGRFYIYASHHIAPARDGRWPLCLDAAQAFGTGQHGSTAGCLLALDILAKKLRHVPRALDMGCGSGILAMAMARAWDGRVDAIDNDALAVRETKRNAKRNHLRSKIHAYHGNGKWLRQPQMAYGLRQQKYKVICANILAKPLVWLAPKLAPQVAAGGYLVLAGLLNRQAPMVLSAYRRHGLYLSKAIRQGNWTTLLLHKPCRKFHPNSLLASTALFRLASATKSGRSAVR